jgi:hypothetical protein
MRREVIILILGFLLTDPLMGQSVEFGIQYVPLQVSKITFDQNYLIFNDYTSVKVLDPSFRLSIPSLSNSGLFVRYKTRRLSYQTGLNFQNNVYFYSKKTSDYTTTYASVFYSSIDVPMTITLVLKPENKLKIRLTAGLNNKLFKIRRNYYSVFAKKFDYFNYAEATSSDDEKRKFMINKVNPFISYLRSGIGIRYYNFTADILLDMNLTDMNINKDIYNANYKNTSQINLVLGFAIAPKDLKLRTSKRQISKE